MARQVHNHGDWSAATVTAFWLGKPLVIYNSLVNVQSNFQNKGIIPYQIKDGIIALYWSVLIYNQLESTIPINSFQLDMGKTVGWPTLHGCT